MSEPLDRLRNASLPGPPPAYWTNLDRDVRRVLFRRRMRRRVAAHMVALVSAWIVTFFACLFTPGVVPKGFRVVSVPIYRVAPEWLLLMQQRARSRNTYELSVGMPKLQDLIKRSSCTVQGTIESIRPDREKLIDDIWHGNDIRPGYFVTIRVEDSAPKIDDSTLRLRAETRWKMQFRTGDEALVWLRRIGSDYALAGSFDFSSVQRIERQADKFVVPGADGPGSSLELQKVWEVVRASRGIANASELKRDAGAIVQALMGEDLDSAIVDAELLLELAHGDLRGADLVDAIKKQRTHVPSTPTAQDERPRKFARFFDAMLKLYLPIAGEESSERLLELMFADAPRENGGAFFNGVFAYGRPSMEGHPYVRIALTLPPPKRVDHLKRVVGVRFDIYSTRASFGKGSAIPFRLDPFSLDLIGATPGADIDEFLLEIFKDPERYSFQGERERTKLYEILIARGIPPK
jgi:hypothetical protein